MREYTQRNESYPVRIPSVESKTFAVNAMNETESKKKKKEKHETKQICITWRTDEFVIQRGDTRTMRLNVLCLPTLLS